MTPGTTPGWADDELPPGPPDPAVADGWRPGPDEPAAPLPAPALLDPAAFPASATTRGPDPQPAPQPAPWSRPTRFREPAALLVAADFIESAAGLPLAGHRRGRRLLLFVLIALLASVSLAAVLVMAAGASRPSGRAGSFGNPPPAALSPSDAASIPPSARPSTTKPPSPPAANPTTAKPTTTHRRPPPIAPISYEAEAAGNIIAGSAWVQRFPGASGGAIIRNLGDWDTRDGPGTLTLPAVRVPATGAYTLTVFTVHLDGEARRTLVVAVAGQPPVSVALTGTATCCASHAIRIRLRAGANAITFGDPDGHAPSIDKIVISAASG